MDAKTASVIMWARRWQRGEVNAMQFAYAADLPTGQMGYIMNRVTRAMGLGQVRKLVVTAMKRPVVESGNPTLDPNG